MPAWVAVQAHREAAGGRRDPGSRGWSCRWLPAAGALTGEPAARDAGGVEAVPCLGPCPARPGLIGAHMWPPFPSFLLPCPGRHGDQSIRSGDDHPALGVHFAAAVAPAGNSNLHSGDHGRATMPLPSRRRSRRVRRKAHRRTGVGPAAGTAALWACTPPATTSAHPHRQLEAVGQHPVHRADSRATRRVVRGEAGNRAVPQVPVRWCGGSRPVVTAS